MRVTRNLFLLLFAAVCIFPVHATTILVLYTPEAVFIASDSKIASTDMKVTWFGCKIHVTENYVWASAGLSFELDGPFSLEKLVPQVLGNEVPSTTSLDRLEFQIRSAFESLIPKLTLIGFDLNKANIGVAIVDTRTIGKVYEMFITTKTFVREQYPGGDMSPHGFVAFGEHGKVDELVAARPQMFREMGIGPALNYLINEQEMATPEYVAGEIALVQVDSTGAHWTQKAACQKEATPLTKIKPVNPN